MVSQQYGSFTQPWKKWPISNSTGYLLGWKEWFGTVPLLLYPGLHVQEKMAKSNLFKWLNICHLFCNWYCSFPALPARCLRFAFPGVVLYLGFCLCPLPWFSPPPCSSWLRTLAARRDRALLWQGVGQAWCRLTLSMVSFKLWYIFPVGIGCDGQHGQNYFF